ncbi:DUF4231 domain-containing protein [Streptomyces albipurpureus]|uniref:DUF4231 domain-containing protein n=1 Tax=Streptomyces albipurpureus TaxID=2897419 RepID=A0ABT0UJ82_9ACTN|nr:DUF4231 domain-containing protein [Streptomyces sp. CWNU-1]MCM2388699.1 DUF4231 domain-containing protein [Streptomyces sp. CWNU-1]
MSELGSVSAEMAVWDEQSVWSQAANNLKRKIGWARAASLLLGIAAAALGTVAAQTMNWNETVGKSAAFASALAAGLIPLLAGRLGATTIENWTRLRSVSEAMKHEVYAFLAGVTPYRTQEARSALTGKIDQLKADSSDLLPHTTGITPVRRELPAVTDIASYTEIRVKGQISGYYRPKAEWMGRRAATARRVQLALGALGALLGALAGAFGLQHAAAWVAVVATVGTAISVHALAAKYDYQHIEFTRTAAELQRLLGQRRLASEGDPLSEDDFVNQCEQVISILNDAWMAKWNTQ